jgi:prevent-host-death family protein
MAEQEETARAYSTDEARDNLGPLILRAGFGNERIPITYHGELRAAIVGLRDLERLQSLDAA